MNTLTPFEHFWMLVLAGSGATFILVNGFIFGPLRQKISNMPDAKLGTIALKDYLVELIQCPTCIGFWTGVLLELALGADLLGTGVWARLLSLFIAGASVSCGATLVQRWSMR